MHGRIFRAFSIGPFFIIPEGEAATTGGMMFHRTGNSSIEFAE